MPITFVDLFSGIGGFHAVGQALGWSAVYACDIDVHTQDIYEKNWGIRPNSDIKDDANDDGVSIPKHDILFAGFPCQPFSKSGKQFGMEEVRGTLFWNIAKTIEHRRPSIVLLENVPNLAGTRHREDWESIIRTLRSLGYRVSSEPLIVSPHTIPRNFGGRPQIRKRIYIPATYVPKKDRSKFPLDPPQVPWTKFDWNPERWDLIQDIKLERNNSRVLSKLQLSKSEKIWIDAWDKFLKIMLRKRSGKRLPGFPLWADVWLGNIKTKKSDPKWKKDFIEKNREFYKEHRDEIDVWLRKHSNLREFPPSRRKFEWQAGDNASIYECLIQLRPSGIRVKKVNYVPALVAITQTTIVGPLGRRLSVRELSQLQGLPPWFSFGKQSDAQSYKQLGNGISIGCAYHVLRTLAQRDRELLLKTCPEILKSIEKSGSNPDLRLQTRH